MLRSMKVLSTPVFTIGRDTTLCDGQSFVLTAPLTGSYLWSTGATTQSISVTTAGTYTLRITNAGGCEGFDQAVIGFSPSPAVSLGKDTSICSGSSLTLNGGSTAGASYLWSTGATTQTIAVTTAGMYHVKVTAGDCFRRDTIVVGVNAKPVVNLGADITTCTSDSVTLNAGNAGSTYVWSTGATTQSIRVSAAGTYTVTVTNGSGCTGQDVLVITNLPEPNGSFTSVSTELSATFSTPTQTGVSYLWDFGDGGISTSSNPTHTYAVAGTYTVKLTVTFVATGCETVTGQAVTVTPPVGIGSLAGAYRLSASPNPFRHTTMISFKLQQESEVSLEIYDLLGRKISTLAEKSVLKGDQNISWNIGDEQAGVYMVRLVVDGRASLIRIVSAE
jgi:PKD repeat protein